MRKASAALKKINKLLQSVFLSPSQERKTYNMDRLEYTAHGQKQKQIEKFSTIDAIIFIFVSSPVITLDISVAL